jgi:hypothetical protein
MPDKNTEGLKVLKASFGVSGNFTDVTKEVSAMIGDGGLDFVVSAQSLGILDPAPGVKKTFQAKITINDGKPTILTKEEGEQFTISAPADKSKHSGPFTSSLTVGGYIIHSLVIFVALFAVMFLFKSGYTTGKLLVGGGAGAGIGILLGVLSLPSAGLMLFFIVMGYALFGGELDFNPIMSS